MKTHPMGVDAADGTFFMDRPIGNGWRSRHA